jgi:hypothetical protein
MKKNTSDSNSFLKGIKPAAFTTGSSNHASIRRYGTLSAKGRIPLPMAAYL